MRASFISWISVYNGQQCDKQIAAGFLTFASALLVVTIKDNKLIRNCFLKNESVGKN